MKYKEIYNERLRVSSFLKLSEEEITNRSFFKLKTNDLSLTFFDFGGLFWTSVTLADCCHLLQSFISIS